MIRKFFIFFLLSISFIKTASADNLLASQLGIKTSQFKVAKNNLVVPFQITSTDRCSFGDLDALFLDLYHSSPETKVLLTLEDFLNPEQIYFTKDLIADQFDEKIIGKGGYQSSLELPQLPSAKLLALYVCKDLSGKSCSGKLVQDVNKTINVYNANSTLPKGFRADDKIYFFSYLLVDKNKVSIVASPLGENEYPVFQDYLKANGISAADAEKITAKVKMNNDLLGSEALSFTDKSASINLLLPRLNSKKCYRPKEAK